MALLGVQRLTPARCFFFPSVGISPAITEHPVDKSIKKGKGLSLFCAAAGKPKPRIKWKKNGRTITADYRIKTRVTSSGSKLRIRDAIVQDSGDYHCVAKNNLGYKSSNKARVDVRGK